MKNDSRKPKNDGVIYPRYRVEAKAEQKETTRGRLKIWQKAGLAMAAIGVLSALGGSVQASRSDFERQLRSSTSDIAESISDSFNNLLTRLKQGSEIIAAHIDEGIQEVKPVVKQATSEAIRGAAVVSREIDDVAESLKESDLYKQAIASVFPAPEPVSNTAFDAAIKGNSVAKVTTTPDTKPLVTPGVTRKLDIREIDEANKKFLEQNVKYVSGNITGPTEVPRTPLAAVDTQESKINYSEDEFSTFSRPFENAGANEVMSELGLTVRDIFYPDVAKMESFTDVITYPKVLPVFTESTAAYSDLVVEEVERFNQSNPDINLSPNVILALIQIETNGVAGATSNIPGMRKEDGAKGLMQIMDEHATNQGLSAKDLYNPRVNLRIGIPYFAEGYKEGLSYGLTEMEAMKFAAMYYNGGPGNALKYFGFMRNIEGVPEPTAQREDRLRIKSQQDIRNYLIKYYGSDTNPGMNFTKYSTNLVALETEMYADSFLRLLIQQKLAIELKNKNLSDEEIRKQLNSSDLILKLSAYIKQHHPKYTDPFLKKEVSDFIIDGFEAGRFGSDILSTEVGSTDSDNIFYSLVRW
jgi:hypothetical protein